MDEQSFKNGLLKAYRGERAAAVMVRRLQDRLPLSEQEQYLADLLVAVETAVGDRLEPLIRHYRLPATLDEEALQLARARADGIASWQGLVEELDERLEEFVTEFRALQDMAPPADRDAFDILVEHEVALIRFGALLQQGKVEEAKSQLLPIIHWQRRDLDPIE